MEYLYDTRAPLYSFHVDQRPYWGSKQGKARFQAALAAAARKVIPQPIAAQDVRLEIVHTVNESDELIDIDNLAKATLDALKQVVYSDDRCVRELRLVRFERGGPDSVSGWTAELKLMGRRAAPHCVLVNVFSDREAQARGIDTYAQWIKRRGKGHPFSSPEAWGRRQCGRKPLVCQEQLHVTPVGEATLRKRPR